MKNIFKDILKGKIVFIGVGNVLRGDDGLGPAFIAKLKDFTDALCIDAGSAPENYLGKIVKESPDTVIIVDATEMDSRPGEYSVLKKEDILRSGFTTHDLSPDMLIEYLESETSADIYMLAVQPENVSFGDGMSESVSRTLEEIVNLIKEK